MRTLKPVEVWLSSTSAWASSILLDENAGKVVKTIDA